MPSGAKKRKAAKKSKQDEAQVTTGRPNVLQAVAERNLEKHFGSQDDQDDESLTPKTPVRDCESDDKGRVATQTGEWVKVLGLDVGFPTSQGERKIESEEKYIPSGPTSLGDYWETVSHDSNCDRQDDFTDYQGSNRNAIYEDEHDNIKGCDSLHFGDAVDLVSSQQEGNLEGSITSVSTEWDLPESIARAAEEAGADFEEANQKDVAEPENADATRRLAPGEEIAEQQSESEAEKADPTDDTSCPHEAFQESALIEGSLLMTQKAAPCTHKEAKDVDGGEATQPIVQVVADASVADQQTFPDVYDGRAKEPIDEQDMGGNTSRTEQRFGDSNGDDHSDEFAPEDAFPDKATEEQAVDASGLGGNTACTEQGLRDSSGGDHTDEFAPEDAFPDKATEEGGVDEPSKENSVWRNEQQRQASLKSEFLCREDTSDAHERPNMTKELEDEDEAPSEGLECSSKIDLVVEEASEDSNISLNAKENLTHELNKVVSLSEVTDKAAEVTEDAKELTPAIISPASIKYADTRLECAMPFGNQDMDAEQLLQVEVLSNLKDSGQQTRQSLPWPFENVDIKTMNGDDDLPEEALGNEAQKGQDIGKDYSDSRAHESCLESTIQLISECASQSREESLECSVMPAETDEVVQPVSIAEKDRGLQPGIRPDSGAVIKEDVYVNQRTVGHENNFTVWWRCCGILDLFLHRD